MKTKIILLTIAFFSLTTYAAQIPLVVKETIGINRTSEMVHNGIPIAREENFLTTDNLIIEDSSGTQIPATFEVLSRWAGGKDDATKPIQWLLVSFPVSLSANSSATFYLKTGTPIARTTKITLTETGENFTINTGPAEFVINKNDLTFFDSIKNETQIIAQNNGGSSSTIFPQSAADALSPTNIVIERSNDNYLCIKLEGLYGNTPTGVVGRCKPLAYKIRYKFFAGSPMVEIYHKFYYPGRMSAMGAYPPPVITVDNVSLNLPEMSGYSSTKVYADADTFLEGKVTAGQSAYVHQKLRQPFDAPHIAELKLNSNSASTEFATQPMLINFSDKGSLAVTIDQMRSFEPQSISTDSGGKIDVNVMAENQYFANLQGTWARVGIAALSTSATYSETLEKVFAPLENRLFAFPKNDYCVESKVFLEQQYTPDETSDSSAQVFYSKLKETTETTKNWLTNVHFQGLMTYGSLIKEASPWYSDLGNGTNWDKIYTGASLTEFHSAWNNVVFQFLQDGNPDNLYKLSFNGARRMLHTQIIQPDYEHSDTQMGWGYSGYGRYRENPNSSHSYFDNLFSYYYLTGDLEVPEILEVGAKTHAGWMTRNQDGTLNDQEDYGVNFIDYIDRVSQQRASVFNFLGHVFDEKYLDDFKHVYNHAFSIQLALLDFNGKECAFISDEKGMASGFKTEQHWMAALYFSHYLYVLYNEFGDLELGSSNIKISRFFKGLANTYINICATNNSGGDGTWPNSKWVNWQYIFYSGNKIGGNYISNYPAASSDKFLYSTGKSSMVTEIYRAGIMNDDSALTNFAKEGFDYIVSTLDGSRPWQKSLAMNFIRLHHAAGIINNIKPEPASEFSFSKAAYLAYEATGSVQIAIARFGDIDLTSTVHYASSDISAIAGQDYTSVSGDLTWLPGDSSPKSIDIVIAQDNVGYSGKQFSVTLSNPENANLVSPFTTEITIIDDDEIPDIDICLSAAEYTADEILGSVEISVYRSKNSDFTSTVHYATSDGTAIAGIDYSSTSGDLTWLLGDLSPKTFSIPIIQDEIEGSNKQFTVSLSGAANANLVSPSSAIITIIDDDLPLQSFETKAGDNSETSGSAFTDDAEEKLSNNSLHASDGELQLSSEELVGLRFNQITIPRRSTIVNAYVQFRAANSPTNINPCFITIYAEDISNAVTFSGSNKISTREKTSAKIIWQPNDWTNSAAEGPDQRTINIANIIQEVINKSTWEFGNSMALIFYSTGKREATSRDISHPPILHIDYKLPETLTEQTVTFDFSFTGETTMDESSFDWADGLTTNWLPTGDSIVFDGFNSDDLSKYIDFHISTESNENIVVNLEALRYESGPKTLLVDCSPDGISFYHVGSIQLIQSNFWYNCVFPLDENLETTMFDNPNAVFRIIGTNAIGSELELDMFQVKMTEIGVPEPFLFINCYLLFIICYLLSKTKIKSIDLF